MSASVESSLRKAKSHERRGELSEALACYQAILSSYPANSRARKGFARLSQSLTEPPKPAFRELHDHYANGRFQQAMTRAAALIETFPQSEPLWTLLGAAATGLENWEIARRAFAQAIELKPEKAKTHANLGAVLERQGEFAAAAACFADALHQMPGNSEYLIAHANCLIANGQIEPAIGHLQAVLEDEPENALAHLSLGTACLTLNDIDRALEHLETAALGDPTCVKTLNNLSSAQFAAGRFEDAKTASEKAIALNPDHAKAYNNLANVQQHLGELDQAIRNYANAARLAPEMHAALTQKLHFQAQICDWSAHDEFRALSGHLGLSGEVVSPWALLGFEDDPARQRQRSEHHARQWGATGRAAFAKPADKPRLRVGYLSGDLYDHATLYLLSGVLESHDSTAFEVVVYGFNKPGKSAQFDRMTAAIDRFTDVHHLSDAGITARARADDLDIAIDLKGYTHGARPGLFFAGLAPVQINYLGYPGTLGSEVFDYIIADDMVIPPEMRPHYSEDVIYLPHSYQPNDDCRLISAEPLTRADCALPEGAVVICCFNSSYKITRDEFDIWMRVLGQVDHSVLWLLDCNDRARDNLRAEAEARGIAGDRLIFAGRLPQDRHLARHRLADFFVDTFNVNAHTTASDALYAGLPVVTLPGQQFAARVGASLCRAVGMEGLIASDRAEYESLILNLARDPAALSAVRASLAQNLPIAALFDTAAYTRDLEAGYRRAWEVWQRSESKGDIHVAELSGPLRKAG